MKEGLIGIALGIICGALLVQSNPKAQEIVEKGKNLVKNKVSKMTK